jgi:hypothetical protein
MANHNRPYAAHPKKGSEEFEQVQKYVCESKVAFDTFSLAKEVAGNRRPTSGPRQPYKCPYCHKWHVGSFLVRKSLQESLK